MHLLQGLTRTCLESDINFNVITSWNLEYAKGFKHQVILRHVPRSKAGIIKFFALNFLKFKKQIKSFPVSSTFIFVMPHPVDFLIRKELKKQGKNVISIVHDPQRHKGEFFPNNFVTREIIKNSRQIITLSTWAQNFLEKNFGVKSIHLPILNPEVSFEKKSSKAFDISFVGRNSKYKGWRNVTKILSSVDFPISCFLQGATLREVSRLEKVNPLVSISGSQGWLEDDALFTVMATSRVIALPYTTATQSGIIPLANKLGTPIVAFDVGGLSEQLLSDGYSKKIKANDFKAFSDHVVTLLRMQISPCSKDIDPKGWVNLLKSFADKTT